MLRVYGSPADALLHRGLQTTSLALQGFARYSMSGHAIIRCLVIPVL